MIRSSRNRLATLSLVALLLAGCGGNGAAEDVLAETAENLEEIESGTLTLRLVVTPKANEARGVGYELAGPFALEGPGALPVARIKYTRIRDSERTAMTLVSTGRRAYVEVDGQAYELPPEEADELRAVGERLEEGEGLGELGLDEWAEDPKLSDGGVVAGVETDRIDARLDVASAAEDLIDLARDLSRGRLEDLPEVDEQTIERATRSARLRLFTGEEDRLLRRLDVDADLGFEVPARLGKALGNLGGARLDFELRLNDPNRAVAVEEPQDALPYSELPDP